MNSYRYDLHLHSCLSPCGDTDMTPNNLVNMAALLGCDIIALTDHNTCRNTPAAVKVGQATDVLVIPGMELCTAEEAHVVCLFETVEDALAFDKYVCAHIPKVPNRPEIFGEQWVLNENDEKIGEISELLITATDISINDKDAYSVTASLGAIPPEAQFSAAELSLTADAAQQRLLHPELESMMLLRSSDAHYLHLMPEEHQTVELPEKTAKALLDVLRGCGAGKFQVL